LHVRFLGGRHLVTGVAYPTNNVQKKLYGSMEELQKDLDEWMDYKNHRTYQGKMCCGRMPIETLEDGKSIWTEKNLAQT